MSRWPRSLSLGAALAFAAMLAVDQPAAANPKCAPHDDIVKVLNKK